MFKKLMLTMLLMFAAGNALAQVDDATGPVDPPFVIAPCDSCNMGARPIDWNDATRFALFNSQAGTGWRFSSLYRSSDTTHISVYWYRDAALSPNFGGVSVGGNTMYNDPNVFYKSLSCFLSVDCGTSEGGGTRAKWE